MRQSGSACSVWLTVEVKSGAAGRLRSLHLALQTYPNCPGGLVFSSAPYDVLRGHKLAFLPLYFAYAATKSHATPQAQAPGGSDGA